MGLICIFMQVKILLGSFNSQERLYQNFSKESRFLVSGPGIEVMSEQTRDSPRFREISGAGPVTDAILWCSGNSIHQGLPAQTYTKGPTNGFYKKLRLEVSQEWLKASIACTDSGKIVQLLGKGIMENRKGQKSIILEAVTGFDTWVWHAFFEVARSQNDLNVLGQSLVFNDILRGEAPNITYQINNTVYQNEYYLADGIYPRRTTFVKSILHPLSQKQKLFAAYLEGYRKDVEMCFGILQARWAIIRGASRLFDEEVLRSIMMTWIILHNMILGDEYDYDAEDVYEPDPMNTTLQEFMKNPWGQMENQCSMNCC